MSQTTTNIGRAQIPDPDLGYDTLDGGTNLHTQLRANFTKFSDHLMWRYLSTTLANGASATITHNFGLNLTAMRYIVFESGTQRTAAQVAADYTVAESGGSSTSAITVTNSSGGSKTFIFCLFAGKYGIQSGDFDAACSIDTTGNIRAAELRTTGNDIVINHDAAGSGADWKLTIRRQSSGMTADAVISMPTATSTLATLGLTETLDSKTLTACGGITLAASAAINWAAGNVALGASIGANTLTVAGASSTVRVPGTLSAATIVTDSDDVVMNNDAAASGADWKLTLRRPSSGMSAAAVITMPSATSTVATLGLAETLDLKTLTGCAGITLTAGSAINWAAGSVALGASIGANTLTVAGASSTVRVPGALSSGTLLTDSDDLVLNNDAAGSGADWKLTVRRPSSGMGAAAIITMPSATTTLVGQDTTDTMSNKTLASPIVTGTLLLQNPSGSQPELHLSEDPDNGTNVVKIKAPASLSGDYTLTLPGDDGNNGEVLTTNGSGTLSWTAVSTFSGSSTDNAVARYDGTSGALQNSGLIIDDSNNLSGVVALTTTGDATLGPSGATNATHTLRGKTIELKLSATGAGDTAGISFYTNGTLRGDVYSDNSAGLHFRNSSSSEILALSDAGVLTVGPASSTAENLNVIGIARIQGSSAGNLITTIRNTGTGSAELAIDAGSSGLPILRFRINTAEQANMRVNSSVLEVNANSGIPITFNTNAVVTIGQTSSTANHLLNGERLQAQRALSNGESVMFVCRNTSTVRVTELGVYKHAGITNSASYLYLQEEDGGNAYYWTDNNGLLRISTNQAHVGTTSGTAVGDQTSDIRLKDDIEDLPYGLSELMMLKPQRYVRKGKPDKKEIGFIAQDIRTVLPEVVYNTHDSHGEVLEILALENPYGLLSVVVKGMQQLKAELDSLKKEKDK